MAGILGSLGIDGDGTYAYARTFGQQVIYDAVEDHLERVSAEVSADIQVFIEKDTTNHAEKYMLPGSGRLQEMGPNSVPAAVRAAGEWNVAYPLKEYAAKVSITEVGFGYMSMMEFDKHIQTVEEMHVATLRSNILYNLFHGTAYTFIDPLWPNIVCQPLANGDSVLYPPVLGSETEATENNYLVSGYVSSAISNTNDPYYNLIDQLEAHFGAPTGGSKIVVFTSKAETKIVTGLAEFTTYTNIHIQPGMDVNTVKVLDEEIRIPGRVLGVHQASGAYMVEHRWIPAGYMLAIHLGKPRPLVRRVDPTETGLSSDLRIVMKNLTFPFTESLYRTRYGIGVGNRLNGVVMQLAAPGAYTPPSLYV